MDFKTISKKDFDRRINTNDEIVCVALGTGWNGAFYMVQPALRNFINKSSGRVKLMLLDYDSNRWLADENEIRFHVPSILVFKHGVKTYQAEGTVACLDLLLDLQINNMISNFDLAHLEN